MRLNVHARMCVPQITDTITSIDDTVTRQDTTVVLKSDLRKFGHHAEIPTSFMAGYYAKARDV